VIVGRDSTVILKDDEESNAEAIKQRVAELWEQKEILENASEKEFVLSRIASLTGGIGVVYVGGNTDLEQKELYDRVDDAVCAVRSALVEGILPGAGIALHNASIDIRTTDSDSEAKKIAHAILQHALVAPICQILENGGMSYFDIYDSKEKKMIGDGYNVKTREYGDVFKMGIIDPVKVTRSALQNAVSVAVTILSTNAIITMARTYEAGE
jgi:chaperonin GroEL